MDLSAENVEERKDMIILETLSQPGEITSVAVGHFLNRKQFTLILAKQTFLSLFNYDAESGTFNLFDHIPIFKQIFSIHAAPQQHLLDCILIISLNGEGVFFQWHENEFFPLAAGQYLDYALSIMENPLRRRYRVDPTFLQYIQMIPIDSCQSTQLSKPIQISRSKPVNENENEITDSDSQSSDIIDADPLLSQRILARSFCFIDESVCVGLFYDGPGADLMYGISENMDDTLEDIPQMCGWGEGYEATLDNGLEQIWRAKQKINKNKTKTENEKEKEKVVIAQTNIFIFSEEGNSETFDDKSIILDNILRVRHVVINVYAIVDTAQGVSLLSFNLDFAKQTMKLGPFVMIGIPSSSSRIIVISNEQNQDSNQLANEIAHQTLKGAEQVEVEQFDNMKDYDLLVALKGQQTDIDTQEQETITIVKKLQKLIHYKRSKSEMLSIQINQNHSTHSSFIPYILASSKAIILQQSISKAYIFPFPNALPIPPFVFCHGLVKPIKHTTAVVTTTSGFPILMYLETGIIKEVDDDDDFCLPNGNIQNVITIPPKWRNLHKIQEDRMAFGVAHGITGRGELQLVSIGHRLVEIIHDDCNCNENTKLFSSQFYAGKGNREFLIVQSENKTNYLSKQSKQLVNVFTNATQYQSTPNNPYYSSNPEFPIVTVEQTMNDNSNFNLTKNSIQKSYSTTLYQFGDKRIAQLDPQIFGIEQNKKIIAFHELQGAVAIISENDISIICTLNYKGEFKQVDDEEGLYQNSIKAGTLVLNIDKENTTSSQTSSSVISSSTSPSPSSSYSNSNSQNIRMEQNSTNQKNGSLNYTTNLPRFPIKQSSRTIIIKASSMKSKAIPGTKWKIPSWFTKEECQLVSEGKIKVEDIAKQVSQMPSRQVTIDQVAVSDNIVVVSHKSVVYVLLWHPALPILLTQKKQSLLMNNALRFSLLAYQDSIQYGSIKAEHNNNVKDRLYFHEQQELNLSIHLQVVCTLKLTSDITALSAATICGNQYFVICTKDPSRARIFRLSIIEEDIEFQKQNKKIWESVKRLGPEEDIMPNEALFGMRKSNFIRKDQKYKAHEGALLLVGGQFGIVESVVIPIAALMLEVPPHRYQSALDALKIGMQPREQKLQNSIHELFTFPPEPQIMDLGRSPVLISEDNRRVIIKGERTYAVRFDPYLGQTVWLSLFINGGIRNIVPVGLSLNDKAIKHSKKHIFFI
ncbi:MAG: hypothetical protein EZS28_003688 [Streblomastix strix]|uniref:Uncharacterized protein n=1 Tax=Streblomastix strix TaxID=222440 RepID=A0A5J4X0L8_9EUKA|nr:MAG: hypothetical protein EZS28_003688 [Streblomastix strix]